MLALLWRHRALLAVLALGAVIRIAVGRASAPAAYQDSLIYIELADNAPFTFTALRPNGYPLFIRALSLAGDLDLVVAAQHVAGLLTGAMAYFLMVRLGTRRWVAALTTGVLVVDAYAVALEQAILTETFFALTLVASAYFAVVRPRQPASLVASGFLLAVAALIRVVGVFAVPVWLVYVLTLRLPRRVALAAATSVLVPLLAYGTFHALDGRGFGFTESDGWILYSKVAPTLNCEGASISNETRPLCNGVRGWNEDAYLYSRGAPAQQLFFGTVGEVDVDERFNKDNNALLRDFAIGVIRAHPITYARTVLDTFAEYFQPNERPPELSLYGQPDSLMFRYERWFHMPWWLWTGAAAAAVLSVFMARGPGSRSGQITFLLATAGAILLAGAATTQLNIRYLVPLFPFLLCAGAMGIEDLLRPARSGEDAPPEPARVSLP